MIDDEELVQVYLEESNDLQELLRADFAQWQSRQDDELLVSLLRNLHTLKGSSRMVGLAAFSEYLHSLEQMIQKIHDHELLPKDEIRSEIQSAFDFIKVYLQHLRPATQEYVKQKKNKEPGADKIRVKTDLLEKFSKLAGQINIARSHLEQQLSGMGKSLVEMTKEISLIQDQMWQVQAKADINFKMIQEMRDEKEEEFDILELDRYSSLQHFSRILVDKLKVVENLNAQLTHSIRSAGSVVNEQRRAAITLEEGITHTRMISIDTVVPRLEKIVSQVSQELGKELRLVCIKAQGEVDRKIVETLIPSLEHMVRNAIDHGIEAPKVRIAAGKSAYGIITLSLFRQGNDIVILLGDDGRGIDINAVKNKAIQKKLWDPFSPMSLNDATQIIALPGFSTKEVVTPISGRGMGMDVVNTVISKLGGTLQIDSKPGLGTQFTIRLPFMQSLNQALILAVEGQSYAIPLANLAGITRVAAAQIEKENFCLEYGQESYAIFYLSEILHGQKWEADRLKLNDLPVVLFQSETKKIGMVIDKLIGSREIFIKSVGLQLQFVKEISGVSLLGNGQIVLILNVPYLIQKALDSKKEVYESKTEQKKTKVLIVDDSATVRQITSQLLNQHRYESATAKDGIEALDRLKEEIPDIVLLDIEMPRMDGFEVIKSMRADPLYKKIPIIMITSRAGEKHRTRAMELGANAYLIKPFQEKELLDLLRQYEFQRI